MVALSDQAGDRTLTAKGLNNLGHVLRQLGEYEAALPVLHDALKLHRELGNTASEALTAGNIAYVHVVLGDYDRAEPILLNNLTLARASGNPEYLQGALGRLGDLEARRDRFREALE